MHITVSFADGSPARISSINTALRHFRPSFIHIWELKTFWHEKLICEDDVEVRTLADTTDAGSGGWVMLLIPQPPDRRTRISGVGVAHLFCLFSPIGI